MTYNDDQKHNDPKVSRARKRVRFMVRVFYVLFAVIMIRVFDLTILQHKSQAPKEDKTERALTAFAPKHRGEIFDAQGLALATNIPTVSFYIDATEIDDVNETAAGILKVLPKLKKEKVLAKLKSGRKFQWVYRHLTPSQQQALNDLGFPGLHFEKTSKRIYPHGALASHVLGFTDIDQNGISGIEKSFNDQLQKAQSVHLALDVRIQSLVREALLQTIDEFSAQGGWGVVVRIATGEIVSMVSLPDFDPNHPGLCKERDRFNQVTLGVYEMGSTFKLLNVAIALDEGLTKLSRIYDATHPVKVDKFTIRDYRGQKRPLSVPEILIYSSNIGSLKIGLEIGSERQKTFLKRLGMLKPVHLELPEKGRPLYPNPWREINTMTISYGHGIAVTALHNVSAVSALASGVLRELTLLKQTGPVMGTRIFSEKTTDHMRRLMRAVVVYGSSRKAAVKGYMMAGKTGTSEVVEKGRYNKKENVVSYLGAFPAHDPEYGLLVMVDRPKGTKKTFGFRTGGWIAAPLAGNVVKAIAPILGVQPVDEEKSEIEKKVALDMLSHLKKRS